MRRIGIIVVLVGVALAGVASLPSAPSVAAAIGRSPAREATVPHAAHVAGLEIGDEHAYDVSLVQTARATGADDFIVKLDGAFAVAYAGTDERGLVFRAELREAKSSVQRGAVDATSAFAATLARPYFFTTTADGRLIAMHFASEVDELSRGALTTLASTFQISRRRAPSFETVESDSLGDYDAHYTQTAAGLHRDRLRYTRVVGGGTLAANVVTTGTEIAVRSDGWPQSIAGNEVTRVGTTDLGVTVDAKFTLRHRSNARVQAGWYDGLQVAAVDASSSRATDQADRDMVDGASLDDLLAELARVADDSHARGYQFLRISALLRLDANAAHAAERSILENAPTAQVLVAALGEAGTPDAQRALGNVIASQLPTETRAHAVASLGLVDAPTPATIDALARIAGGTDEIAAAATLAQGNTALRMRDDDPAAADRQVDALLARLARATDDEERALVLRALGNTGDARILSAVGPQLADANAMVRVAATEALRLVPGADALIVARLRDTSALVRGAAVFAASQRDLTPYIDVLAVVARRDSDVEVRRAIVELAGARKDEHQALRGIVEYAANNDGDAELREMAKQLLAVLS